MDLSRTPILIFPVEGAEILTARLIRRALPGLNRLTWHTNEKKFLADKMRATVDVQQLPGDEIAVG